MSIRIVFLLCCVTAGILSGCGRRNETPSAQRQAVVVAIEGDIDSFNPLFAEDVTAGEINDLLFPALVGSEFDLPSGVLKYTPLLAHSWDHGDQNRDLTFHLQTNAHWSDSVLVTARDVQFSYELYGDPEVASVRQGAVDNLRLTHGKLDVSKSVEVLDDSTVVFHFSRSYPGQLFDAGLPILPSHILEKLPRQNLRTATFNKAPVACGPFALERWTPLQETVLRSNPLSTTPYPAKLSALVFRIVPDYRSRISQLKVGEVDVVSELRPEDAEGLAATPSLEIVSTPGRNYDFLGWNNIDPKAYAQSGGKTVKPHRLFGSATVRRALTIAINRDEIVKAYLGQYGRVAFGGVSPLFKWAYDGALKPLPYDPAESKRLLAGEGWKDTDNDGILDKNGAAFSFVLKVPAGNQMRNSVATAVQQQLRQIHIDMKIEQVERGTFWQEVTTRTYDAWLAGFSVPLQMQLDDLWGSDLQKYPFNLVGFRNRRVDEILAAARLLQLETDGAPLWKEFQEIVQREQPCTFLYWINNIVAVNARVRGTQVGVLGTTHNAWDWYIGSSKATGTD